MTELVITSSDKGIVLDGVVGQLASIQLGESPSTGYRWAMEAVPRESVELLDSHWSEQTSGIGAAGVRTFRIRFRSKGELHLHLKLWRAWQGESSVIERYDFVAFVQ